MGRKRLKKKITTKNIYNTYKKKYGIKYYCNLKEFQEVSELYFKLLSLLMINTGVDFKLPNRLGYMKVVKFKTEKRSIDWKTTNLLFGEHNKNNSEKKRIYFNNNHSDGYAARFWWEPSRWLKYHSLYRFKPTRFNNRYLTKQIKDNNTIVYYQENYI